MEPTVIPGGLAATWATRAVAEIDGNDIHSVVADARKNGIPGLTRNNMGTSEARGRKMHAALSVLFRWLLQHRRVPLNPTVGVWHPGAPPPRKRVLTEAELKSFWRAADAVGGAYGAAFKMLLLTGARLNEVAGMRRAELSDDGIWIIPGARTKNHNDHSLALPPLARSIIDGLPKIDGDFVFSNSGRRQVTGFSRAKAQLDAAMGDALPWRLHDLRRTAATGMAGLGIAPHIVEAVLNHSSGFKAGVAGVYNLATYEPEKAAALARWAAHVEGLVAGRRSTVTPISRRRRR